MKKFRDAKAYTYFPFSNNTTCNNTTPVPFKNNKSKSKSKRKKTISHDNNKRSLEFFPNKVKNMQGCPVYVATFNASLYMTLKKQTNGSYHLGGFEGNLLRCIATRLNFTPVINIPENNTKWGVFQSFPNGSRIVTGARKMIIDREANLTIGGISNRHDVENVIDASVVYYQSKLVMVVPQGKKYTPLQKLFRPFHLSLWIVLAITWIIGFTFTFILRTFSKVRFRELLVGYHNRQPFFNMNMIFLGSGVLNFPRNFTARNLIVVWMLTTLIIRTTYQGTLYNNLQQTNNRNPIKTMEKLIDEKYVIFINEIVEPLFEGYPKAINLMKVYKGFEMDAIWSNIREPNSHSALVIPHEFVDRVNSLNYSQYIYTTLKHPIRLLPICTYFTKGSYLTKPVSTEIQIFLSSGLIKFWIRKNRGHRFSSVLKTRVRIKQVLKIQHFTGTIYLCFFFYIISILIFVLEILSQYCIKIKKFLDVLTY